MPLKFVFKLVGVYEIIPGQFIYFIECTHLLLNTLHNTYCFKDTFQIVDQCHSSSFLNGFQAPVKNIHVIHNLVFFLES